MRLCRSWLAPILSTTWDRASFFVHNSRTFLYRHSKSPTNPLVHIILIYLHFHSTLSLRRWATVNCYSIRTLGLWFCNSLLLITISTGLVGLLGLFILHRKVCIINSQIIMVIIAPFPQTTVPGKTHWVSLFWQSSFLPACQSLAFYWCFYNVTLYAKTCFYLKVCTVFLTLVMPPISTSHNVHTAHWYAQ